MASLFHVTSSTNRASIEQHGLDWTHMGAARGVAGSIQPECDGVFLCQDRFEVDFFCRMNAAGGPIDVWAVDGVDESELVESDSGFVYLPRVIPPSQLRLDDAGRTPDPPGTPVTNSTAHRSTLTITFDDEASR